MDSFEFNKIAAGILVTALLVIGLNQITDFIYQVKKPEKPGYKIEGVAETKATGNKSEIKKEEKLTDIKIELELDAEKLEDLMEKIWSTWENERG